MRRYLLAVLVIVILSAGIVVGLLLVQQQQIFKQKASTPTGVATVSITPSQASFERNTQHPVSVYFNTKGLSVSGVSVRLTFSNLGVTASGIQIASDLLSSGDWNCPVKSVTSAGSTGQIDISCLNTAPVGYSNNSDILLATFNLSASQIPIQNPLIVGFDPVETVLTQKSDSSDIALTPVGTGSYTIIDTIAGSPSPTPVVIVSSPTPTASSLALAATPTPTATTLFATATPTPIPTGTAFALATYTPTPIGTSSVTATNPPIPVTGFDAPTVLGVVGGVVLLFVGALILIF